LKERKKGAGGVTQVVDYLPIKGVTLSSNPPVPPKKKRGKRTSVAVEI
jgi:hypothetical protein